MHNQIKARIEAEFINAGMPSNDNWYTVANEDVRRLATKHSIAFNTCAAIVAALSPRIRWETKNGKKTNLNAADTLITGYRHHDAKASVFSRVAGFDRNKRKAWDILRSGDPTLLSGDKVTSFYRNIVDPDDDSNITVDSWIISIALGLPINTAKNNYIATSKLYSIIRTAILEVASYFGVSGTDLQATIWQNVKERSTISQ